VCIQHFQFATVFTAVLLWHPCNPGFSAAIDVKLTCKICTNVLCYS